MIVGIGVDSVDIDHMRRVLERTPTFKARCFTQGERDYAEQMNDCTQRYAVRFAAKEAVMKAMGLGLGAFGFYDVETVTKESGEPVLVITGRAQELAQERNITSWHISLTHTDLSAIAMVVAES